MQYDMLSMILLMGSMALTVAYHISRQRYGFYVISYILLFIYVFSYGVCVLFRMGASLISNGFYAISSGVYVSFSFSCFRSFLSCAFWFMNIDAISYVLCTVSRVFPMSSMSSIYAVFYRFYGVSSGPTSHSIYFLW